MNTEKLEKMATKAMHRCIPKKIQQKIERASLGTLSGAYIRLMGAPGGMVAIPRQLLGKDGLIAGDIKKMAGANWSRETIKAYYWNCPEFRDLWKLMSMEEANLDYLIEQNSPSLPQ